jgi:hypothetical protein
MDNARESVALSRKIHKEAQEWKQHVNSLDDKSLDELYLITKYGSVVERAIKVAKQYE